MQSRPTDSYGRDLLDAGVAFNYWFFGDSSSDNSTKEEDGGILTSWKVFPNNNKKGSYNAYEQVSTKWDGDPTDVYQVHNNDGSIDTYNSTIELNKAGITNVNRQYKNDKGFTGNLKEAYNGWVNATGRTAAAKETMYAYIGGVASIVLPGLASEFLVARGGSWLVPLGRGTTGRTAAANITEQLAMKEAMSNPSAGKVIMEGLKDSRWAGWSKMQYVHTSLNGKKTVIHYVAKFERGVIKYVDDFKFK